MYKSVVDFKVINFLKYLNIIVDIINKINYKLFRVDIVLKLRKLK